MCWVVVVFARGHLGFDGRQEKEPRDSDLRHSEKERREVGSKAGSEGAAAKERLTEVVIGIEGDQEVYKEGKTKKRNQSEDAKLHTEEVNCTLEKESMRKKKE